MFDVVVVSLFPGAASSSPYPGAAAAAVMLRRGQVSKLPSCFFSCALWIGLCNTYVRYRLASEKREREGRRDGGGVAGDLTIVIEAPVRPLVAVGDSESSGAGRALESDS